MIEKNQNKRDESAKQQTIIRRSFQLLKRVHLFNMKMMHSMKLFLLLIYVGVNKGTIPYWLGKKQRRLMTVVL